jgi:putative ABC transport system ATP-binding protein
LKHKEKRKIHTLSGGEQQRVALARLLLKPCNIILADEPTGNLDEDNTEIILHLLMDLSHKGKTVVMVTHDHSLLHHFNKVINLDEFVPDGNRV